MLGVCCPFCSDSGFHLGINIEAKTISCFKCGTTGTILKYLTEELRSFTKALEAVKKIIPRELISFRETAVRESRVSKVELPKGAKQGLGNRHMEYLRYGRKYPILDPKKLADEYNLHSTGPVGRYPNRIIVPVVRNHRLVTYTTISIADEAEERYKHLPETESIISIKDYLYNFHTVKKVVFVVEGLFDCWRLGETAVPTFGTKVTDAQIRLLATIPNVILLFDGDEAGYQACIDVSEKLAAFTNVYQISMPAGRDPDGLTPHEVSLIKNAQLNK